MVRNEFYSNSETKSPTDLIQPNLNYRLDLKFLINGSLIFRMKNILK